jgi:hypothetical protein
MKTNRNSSELAGYVHEYLKANNLTHLVNYLNCPKSNAFIEQYNRTIKEHLLIEKDYIENCD